MSNTNDGIGFEAGGGWCYCRDCDMETRFGLDAAGVRKAWMHTALRHPVSFCRIMWRRITE